MGILQLNIQSMKKISQMDDFNCIYNISVKFNVIFSFLAEEKKIAYYLKNKSIITKNVKSSTGDLITKHTFLK